MKFEVTILGCGSAIPTKSRTPTAQIINIQECYFLADCAEGTQLQLRNNSVKLQRIDAVFITHLHGDHFYGLPGLISTLHLLGRDKALTIYGPPKLESLVMPMVDMFGAKLRYEVIFVKTQNKKKELLFENNRVKVYSFPLLHKIPTTGFLFTERPKSRVYLPKQGEYFKVPKYWIDRIKQGADFVNDDGETISNKLLTSEPEKPKSYAFCTDTAYYPKLAMDVQDVDLMYHEASFLEEDRKRALLTKHSTAKDAASVAKLANAKKLVLGHFSARYRDLKPFKEEAQIIFKNVELAKDGLLLKV